MKFSKKRIKKWGKKSEDVAVIKFRQAYELDKFDYCLMVAKFGKRPDNAPASQYWDNLFESTKEAAKA